MKPLWRPLSSLAFIALSLFRLAAQAEPLTYGWQNVDGVNLFYREAGPRDAPTIVFLHGNPSSSIQYVAVMERLAASRSVHVLSVDYPSFGYSDAPDRKSYPYTFDQVATTVRRFIAARGVTRFGLFMQDYGVPIGFRLISAAPDSITAIIVQNGVIHLDGFPSAQDPNGPLRRHWRERNAQIDRRRTELWKKMVIPAAGWTSDERLTPEFDLLNLTSARRPGVIEARNDLWFDYGTNVERYPEWQATLRRLKVPVLIVWGSRDDFFTAPGALAYLHDAPQAEVHIIDAGHFATLDAPDEVVRLTSAFLDRHREVWRAATAVAH